MSSQPFPVRGACYEVPWRSDLLPPALSVEASGRCHWLAGPALSRAPVNQNGHLSGLQGSPEWLDFNSVRQREMTANPRRKGRKYLETRARVRASASRRNILEVSLHPREMRREFSFNQREHRGLDSEVAKLFGQRLGLNWCGTSSLPRNGMPGD